ncbi:MAG: biopolymer transporter ExbD [Bacteroidales bacterium]|jgi:biopolymer transport protein ExbD|nr:biopolymer transporter ExbD [Bacteroidales bacterium]MDD4001854.1 biopolymer transporter ExbD [Bacteroidales bacterium]MDD4528905.1 biopolymer transporter ExbD [Bacteroidales bacterium]MDD4828951.1 biopolymer transporter ExbD [Bacteroidales bacterium]
MGKFKQQGEKSTPALNAGSMSDIIFMFLFFFMIITTMRESTLFVRVNVPQGSEIQKLEKKSLNSYIHIGPPIEERKFGSAPRIQLNDQFAEVSDIRAFVESERAARDEVDVPFITTTIKCDKEVKMGDVSDIKQELRQVGALRIMYAASRRSKDTY